MKRKLNTFAFFISIAATLLAVYAMWGAVRAVDIITLFFSGVMAGVSTINFIRMKKGNNIK